MDHDLPPIIALPISHSKYPRLLKEISDPPRILYVRGRSGKIQMDKTIAIVGSRDITPYGIYITEKIVKELVSYGFTIVSGMARGVDTVAHESAIGNGGKTIAVLGCGIDIVAPPSNARLYARIAHGGGAIVSEISPGVKTTKAQFVTRNRIISGLSLGVVVIEGSEHSGSLITARYAGEQGREVFAVPGSVTSPNSRAPSILLKNGAKLVESVDDILEEL